MLKRLSSVAALGLVLALAACTSSATSSTSSSPSAPASLTQPTTISSGPASSNASTSSPVTGQPVSRAPTTRPATVAPVSTKSTAQPVHAAGTCSIRSLSISDSGTNIAKGQMRYGTIVARNVSGRSCTITGYPGITLLSGPSKGKFPTKLERATGTSATRVTLKAGSTASFGFSHFGSPGGHCNMIDGLRVFDPNGSGYAVTNSSFTECSGIPATFTVGPFRAGDSNTIVP